MSPVIEVVVPIYKGLVWIESCLQTLDAQTIDRDKFHVTFVFNGEDDGAMEVAMAWLTGNSEFPAEIIECELANAAAARNVGIRNSKASHVTFLDVDDLISENYLELLHQHISHDVVPAALMVDLGDDRKLDSKTVIAQEFLSHEHPLVTPDKCQRLLSFMVAKVIPINWALDMPLAERLRSGEDVAFFGSLLTKHDFKISLWPGALGATYIRRKVAGSLSRKPATRDFLVAQRTDVIEELSRALALRPTSKYGAITQSYMNSQASFIRRYLADNPLERQSVMDEITARGIQNFPWRVICGTPEDLVIAYNFAPYTDTGATIVSKRIRQSGKPVDVISNSMGATRESLHENLILARPYIAQHHELKAPTSFSSPAGVQSFLTLGLETYERLVGAGRRYQRIYSRSMWPASHFLAAMIKFKNPELVWTAEFSDPVRLTTEGTFRSVPLAGTSLFDSLKELVESDSTGSFLADPDLYSWTEALPYLLADKLLFTNSNQLETMKSYAPSDLKSTISAKAQIEIHPTLPPDFYQIGRASLPPADKINIGYFGDFYSTRGLQEVIAAMHELTEEERSRIALSVFTSKPPTELESESIQALKDVIRLGAKVSFLDFLATLNAFDVLIVNDAETKDHHERNPYLPSKLSDYRGSQSSIWSIFESGSPLSQFSADYRSERGNAEDALIVLRQIAQRKPSRTAVFQGQVTDLLQEVKS